MTFGNELTCGLCGCPVPPGRPVLTMTGLSTRFVYYKDLCRPCADAITGFIDAGAEHIKQLRARRYEGKIAVQIPALALITKDETPSPPGQPTADDVKAYVEQVLGQPLAAEAVTDLGPQTIGEAAGTE